MSFWENPNEENETVVFKTKIVVLCVIIRYILDILLTLYLC